MCGIAGIVGLAPGDTDIKSMLAAIPYRGPDGFGLKCFDDDRVSLGHRRLRILDLTEAGSQPMSSRSGRYWVVYNGEIYNYVELRTELDALGWTFHTSSDTEVLLAAYEQWGPKCLDRFLGMFAFAIWDRDKRELFAARDRLGIKPFYYKQTAEGLLFASEVKSILAVSSTAPCIVDLSLIDAYMEFGYVPGAATLHKGIQRLLPGHSLTWRDGHASIFRYWDVTFGCVEDQSFEDCSTRTRELLQQSVNLHLRSDVPLGIFLSGGVDSSAVVALLEKNAQGRTKTFSVAYDGPDFDETSYAREVSKAYDTEHYEIRVRPKEFADFVPRFIWHMDEPVTESAAISLYYVSKLAREHVVVCLSGEGSDELFAGYDFYSYNLAIERAQSLVGKSVFGVAARVAGKVRRLEKARKYLTLASRGLDDRYCGVSTYDPAKKQGLYTAGFSAVAERGSDDVRNFLHDLFDRSREWDTLSKMLYFDTKTWLVDDLLIKADRMSMATSVELRVPFLDHRLVEYAASIPSKWKLRLGNTKRVLKHSLVGLLPRRILERRKMGFPTPLEMMLRGPLFDYAHDLLLSTTATDRGYFARDRVSGLLHDHRSGKAANHREIWQLIVLEEWHRQFGY